MENLLLGLAAGFASAFVVLWIVSLIHGKSSVENLLLGLAAGFASAFVVLWIVQLFLAKRNNT